MKARVSQLHKTEADWNRLSSFVPLSGEFIIFDPDKTHEYAPMSCALLVKEVNKLPLEKRVA